MKLWALVEATVSAMAESDVSVMRGVFVFIGDERSLGRVGKRERCVTTGREQHASTPMLGVEAESRKAQTLAERLTCPGTWLAIRE